MVTMLVMHSMNPSTPLAKCTTIRFRLFISNLVFIDVNVSKILCFRLHKRVISLNTSFKLFLYLLVVAFISFFRYSQHQIVVFFCITWVIMDDLYLKTKMPIFLHFRLQSYSITNMANCVIDYDFFRSLNYLTSFKFRFMLMIASIWTRKRIDVIVERYLCHSNIIYFLCLGKL